MWPRVAHLRATPRRLEGAGARGGVALSVRTVRHAMLAFAQLSRPAPQAARPAPSRGAARVAAPQRPPAARFLRLVAAAKREDDRFDSVFTSRSDAALAYVCVDCGFIYTDSRPFEKLPSSYKCPSCKAPKSSFVQKDVSAVNALLPALAAVAALAAAGAYALQQL